MASPEGLAYAWIMTASKPVTGYRKSALLRVGCNGPDALQAAIRPFVPGSAERIRQIRFADIEGGNELLEQLRIEYRELLLEIALEGPHFEQAWGVELVRELILDPSRKVDARIEWPGGRLRIKVTEGLCLALDDALLNMLCVLGFFTSRPAADDRPDAYLIAECGPATPDRYVDYSSTLGLDGPELAEALTRMLPLDNLRLAQADLLLALALGWITLHEQAHALLGHVAWLRDRRQGRHGRIDEALFLEASTAAERDESYCLELQADALATQILFSYGMSEEMSDNRWVRRYQAALARHGGDRLALAPDLATREGRFHAMLLASTISSLLFELRRERIRTPGVSHPPPATRLLNILATAVSAWSDVSEYEQDLPALGRDEYPVEVVRPAAHIVGRVFVELEMAARVIGLESPLYRGRLLFSDEVGPPTRGDLSPLADDFHKLLAGILDLEEMSTDAAQTYVSLLARSRALYEEMEGEAQVEGFR